MMMNKVLVQLTQNAVPKYFFDLLFLLVNQHRRYLLLEPLQSTTGRDDGTPISCWVGSNEFSFFFYRANK